MEADLHQTYGVDLDDPALRRRTWRWLKLRIVGLLSSDSRLSNALRPPDAPSSSASTSSTRPVAYDDSD